MPLDRAALLRDRESDTPHLGDATTDDRIPVGAVEVAMVEVATAENGEEAAKVVELSRVDREVLDHVR